MAVAARAEGLTMVEAPTSPRDELIVLLERWERPLCNYLRVIVRDDDVVFDCVQDTFLRAYEQLQRGRTIKPPWLYKVARNRAVDAIRHRNRFDSGTDPSECFGAAGSESDRSIRVRQALDLLPGPERELLYLAIVDRFKTEEIGAMLGIRSGAVRVRLFRARERFRTVYGGLP